MATIALYANRINQMPSLIRDVKQTVSDYKTELLSLKSKTLTVIRSVCNLDDIISSIQTSSQTQEIKATALDTFSSNCEDFISDASRVDGSVADEINRRKDDFYDNYSYLKPECEKSLKEQWDDFWDGAGQWCKEHWKLIVTALIVIAAIVVIVFFPAAAPLLLLLAKGALLGAAIGGIAGGAISAISGGSFWEGFENGAFSGAIAGLISGGMGFALSAGGTIALSLGQTMLIGAVSGAGTSLISDIGDILIKGKDISFGQVLLSMGFSAALGAAFAGIGYGISKGFQALKIKFGWGAKANAPGETVTYRRVQGGDGTNASYERITINSDGTISIANKGSNLNISVDDGAHSSYFRSIRGEGSYTVEFEIPTWFDDFLQGSAIPQSNYTTNPLNQGGTVPKVVDPTKPGLSFELPPPWVEWLEELARNARTVF